jgi:hypothetical protein
MNKKLFADKHNIIGEAYQMYYIQSKKAALLDSANHHFNVAASMLIKDNFQPEYTKALFYMREAKSAALAGIINHCPYTEKKKFPVISRSYKNRTVV